MRKVILLATNILITTTIILAQTPNAFKYQTVIRNTRGDPLTDKNVELKISILHSNINGEIIYSELHKLKTNKLGMVNLDIGTGLSSNNFEDIEWGKTLFFLKVELAKGRDRNFITLSTSQLLAVPYALHAKTAEKLLYVGIEDSISQSENEIQNFSFAEKGDTLYLSKSNFILVPGLSKANQEPSYTLTDYDGNTYKTVKIGNQIWMAENLRVTHFADGRFIPNTTINTEYENIILPWHSWYNNISSYKKTYGALYNWEAVKTRRLCPKGWKVPNDDDWEELINKVQEDGYAEQEGNALRSITGWNENSNGKDYYGFNALPAGLRRTGGIYAFLGVMTMWWIFNDSNEEIAYYWSISSDSNQINRQPGDKNFGYSVRCVSYDTNK